MATDSDASFISINERKEVDIDEKCGGSRIKSILYIHDQNSFYFVCNQLNENLGFYLISFHENEPENFKVISAVITKLEIDNVNMYFSKGFNSDKQVFKEMVIGYKTIYINTYNTVVQDLLDDSILFKHEAF